MHLQSSINHSSQKLHWTEKSSIKRLIMNYISRTNISQPVHTQFSLMLNQGVWYPRQSSKRHFIYLLCSQK